MKKNIIIVLLLAAVIFQQYLQNRGNGSEPQSTASTDRGESDGERDNKPQIEWEREGNSGYDFEGKVYRVVDGDSLYIDGVKKQIRMWGVDAPERDERGYDEARLKLAALAKDQYIQCKRKDTDKYGRNVAQCFQRNGEDINQAMIASGLTKEYCRFTKNYYKSCR